MVDCKAYLGENQPNWVIIYLRYFSLNHQSVIKKRFVTLFLCCLGCQNLSMSNDKSYTNFFTNRLPIIKSLRKTNWGTATRIKFHWNWSTLKVYEITIPVSWELTKYYCDKNIHKCTLMQPSSRRLLLSWS